MRPDRRARMSRYRRLIADEAAMLMIEGFAEHYLDAKKKAARTVLRGAWARRKDLPSNGEIRDAILRSTALSEGSTRQDRLFAMRVTAWEWMQKLVPYRPRLIGSVATGHARRGSDIDLHVFVDDPELLEQDLVAQGEPFEREDVTIRVPGGFRTFLHLHLHDRFPIELSVYPERELRITSRSSTDGRPIDRVSRHRLEARLAHDHPAAWSRYERLGVLDWVPEPANRGRFDALLER